MTENVFADLLDEDVASGADLRKTLLADALRGFAPFRKTLVQRPKTETTRAAVLAELVRARQHRPLKTLLLLHALHPILGDPLPLGTWAKMLDGPKLPCSSSQASEAFNALVTKKLITRSNSGQHVEVAPLLEDGSGEAFVRAGTEGSDVGPGYFTVPYEFWTTGLVDKLTLPGTAMFLIMLAETTQKATFAMAVERAHEWYGISERTAERGYAELGKAGVLLVHRQLVRDPRSPTGLRAVHHRALTKPYSTEARAHIQKASSTAVRARATADAARAANAASSG